MGETTTHQFELSETITINNKLLKNHINPSHHHMTMLNAYAEAHAFASLTQWNGGILGVLLPKTRSDSRAKELGRPVSPKQQVKFYFL